VGYLKLDRIKAKVQRADKHIYDLRVALDAFYRENRNVLVREIDSEREITFSRLFLSQKYRR
jgi:hypothetical protein